MAVVRSGNCVQVIDPLSPPHTHTEICARTHTNTHIHTRTHTCTIVPSCRAELEFPQSTLQTCIKMSSERPCCGRHVQVKTNSAIDPKLRQTRTCLSGCFVLCAGIYLCVGSFCVTLHISYQRKTCLTQYTLLLSLSSYPSDDSYVPIHVM